MFIPDPSQAVVIAAQSGSHLVLAPPGCGKTHILAERIRHAHEKCGVGYADMLCLTFTNRAARAMRERIRSNVDDREVEQVYVGNVHRYCSRFLFENALIPAETSVIDDDDSISLVARFFDDDEMLAVADGRRRRRYTTIVQLAAYMHQIDHRHSRDIRLNPDCLTSDEVRVISGVCANAGKEFTREAMLDIYRNADMYRAMLLSADTDITLQREAMPVLKRLEAAAYYTAYKRQHHLIDFEDILLLAYDALADDNERRFRRYPWVQVDEVQDLNPLQMRIIDLLSVEGCPDGCYMYLGDEQQAIFSFMGAKMSTLQMLKQRCGDNVHKLSKNHRSPKYLLQVFNHYAYHVLGIARDMLPTSDYVPVRTGGELVVVSSPTLDNEYYDVAQQAQRLAEQNPTERAAVIVTSNNDADLVCAAMDRLGVKHFKVSGTEMFSLPEVKLVLSHLSVFANEHNFIAWARLLRGFRVYEQAASARFFVKELADRALLPTDLLVRSEGSYVGDFLKVCGEREVVVFDTETTGLNVEEDDIVQIAAMKMCRGVVVPGSDFVVYIHTEREIPLMLGDVVNPLVEELKHQQLLLPEEALEMFMDYADGAPLVGHNVDYDYAILSANLRRYLPGVRLEETCPQSFDTLKLARLLEPGLHQYKLGYLLEKFHLAGDNSHLADADVAATCNVVSYCLTKAAAVVEQQREFLSRRSVRERASHFRRVYAPLWIATRARLGRRQADGERAALASEIDDVYAAMLDMGVIPPVKNFAYIGRYVDSQLVDISAELTLREQLHNHMLELSTMRESDLCTGDIIDERVFVSTVHKAKGLEFDNVVVFDVADDRYPGFFAHNDAVMRAEDARKLYVALTRARRRIVLAVAAMRHNGHGEPLGRNLSPFLTPVLRFFTSSRPDEG